MKKYLFVITLVFNLSAQEIAVVKLLEGSVHASKASKVIELSVGSRLEESMVIQTSSKSSTTIVFDDNSVLVLGENSIINLKKYYFSPQKNSYDFRLFLKAGAAVFESGKISKVSPESFIFQTPQGTIAIRGTKFAVKVE